MGTIPVEKNPFVSWVKFDSQADWLHLIDYSSQLIVGWIDSNGVRQGSLAGGGGGGGTGSWNFTPPLYSNGGGISGTINGINPVFVLSAIAGSPANLLLFNNGIYQSQVGISPAYSINGTIITFNAGWIPQIGDQLVAI